MPHVSAPLRTYKTRALTEAADNRNLESTSTLAAFRSPWMSAGLLECRNERP